MFEKIPREKAGFYFVQADFAPSERIIIGFDVPDTHPLSTMIFVMLLSLGVSYIKSSITFSITLLNPRAPV